MTTRKRAPARKKAEHNAPEAEQAAQEEPVDPILAQRAKILKPIKDAIKAQNKEAKK